MKIEPIARQVFGERAAFYTTSQTHKDPQVLARLVALAMPQANWWALDEGQRQAFDLKTIDGTLYMNHWYVMVAARKESWRRRRIMSSGQNLELIMRHVGPWPVNTYALICPITGESVLIDPGADPDALEEMLQGSEPAAILLTHSHPDHVGALDEMRERLAVPVMAHPGPHFEGVTVAADRHLTHGDRVPVGQYQLRVYHTPGHIEDLICFALWDDNARQDDRRIIVGDAIFEGGPGKTWSSEGFQTTLQTLESVVLSWPDEAVCYPGHGPAFRLGDIRPAVEAFLNRDHGDFFGDATWDQA